MNENRMIDTELDAIILFQQTNETITCTVRNVARDYKNLIVTASDRCICEYEDVDLIIISPADSSPIRCVGRTIWHLEDDVLPGEHKQYTARVSIADISRIDQRRLELLIDQRQALVVNGYPRTSSL